MTVYNNRTTGHTKSQSFDLSRCWNSKVLLTMHQNDSYNSLCTKKL